MSFLDDLIGYCRTEHPEYEEEMMNGEDGKRHSSKYDFFCIFSRLKTKQIRCTTRCTEILDLVQVF